jgi:outer membrane biosynthesis protein TonB
MRVATLLLTIGLSLSLGGCWFNKKTVVPPPPPAPQPKQSSPVKPPEQPQPEQKPLPMPPPPEIKEPEQITLPAPQKSQPSRPPAKKRAPPPAPPQTPPPAEQPQVQATPPPQLGEILSNAQRRQYEADYAQCLSRARSALQQASGKLLSSTQRGTVERIQTFIQQAEESKARDLATALQLARRADVLGQDLLKDFP